MVLTKSPKTGNISAVIKTDFGERSISTGTKDMKEAKAITKAAKVADLERTAKVHRLTNQTVSQIVAGKSVTVADAAKEWVAWMENYSQAARSVENFSSLFNAWIRDASLADRTPSQVTERMVDAWVNNADAAGAGTRKVRLSIVRSFFKFCTAKVYALGNPAKLVRVKMNQLSHAQKEPKVVQAFNEAELDKLTVATSGFWHCAIVIGRWTGLRIGDICQLEWDCLETPGRMTVWTDKRDRRVSLPLTLAEFEKDMKERNRVTPEMRGHFERMEAEFVPCLTSLIRADKRYLFPDQREIAIDPKRRALTSVQFSRLCATAGIEGKSFHSVRHSYIQQMDRIGIAIEHIARSVGHRQTTTTKGYMQ